MSGSTQLKQREILWRKTQKRIKRNWKMALWSCPGPRRFKWTLFEMCQWNCRELLHVLRWKFRDLSFPRNFFDLGSYLSKRRVLKASKRNLEREISTTAETEFFSREVCEVQSKPLLSSHLYIDTCWVYTKLIWSPKPLEQVNHFTVKLKTLIWVFERIKALNGAMRMTCIIL